jgi:hypothetical protein
MPERANYRRLQIGATADRLGQQYGRIGVLTYVPDSIREILEAAAETTTGHLGDSAEVGSARQLGVHQIGALVVGDYGDPFTGFLQEAGRGQHGGGLSGAEKSAERNNSHHKATSARVNASAELPGEIVFKRLTWKL